jgi:hypothetical protein
MVDAKIQLMNALAEAKKDKCNILTPAITTEGLTPLHAVTVEQLELSPDPKQGDVYPHDKGKMIIHKQGLEKLSNLAGIEMIKTMRTDAQNDRQYISYQAGGFIRKADGSVVMCIKTYGMDFEVIEEEVLEGYQEKMAKWVKDKGANQWPNNMTESQRQEWITDKSRKEVRRRRKYKDQLCESGAQARVKRDLLGLKTFYSPEELKRPFVVVRVVLKPDYNDPKIKMMLTQAAISASGQIFGIDPQLTHVPPPIVTPAAQITHEDIPEIEPAALPNGEISDADYEDAAGADSPPDPAELARADFVGSPFPGAMIKIIDKLIIQKAYDKKQLKKGLDQFTEPQIVSFYDALVEMPDDDIPF